MSRLSSPDLEAHRAKVDFAERKLAAVQVAIGQGDYAALELLSVALKNCVRVYTEEVGSEKPTKNILSRLQR